MPDPMERRTTPRIAIIGRPGARTLDGLPVRLADLSIIGARLTHTEPFYPGAVLTLQFPPDLDGLQLVSRIAWTTTYGSEQTPEGERHTLYQSGAAFGEVSPAQQVALEHLVERFRHARATAG